MALGEVIKGLSVKRKEVQIQNTGEFPVQRLERRSQQRRLKQKPKR